MKIQIALFALLASLICTNLFGQGAGNYMINQKKSYSATENNFSDEVYQYNTRQQQQQYYAPSYTSIGDTIIQLEASVMMNVKADSYIAIFGMSQVSESIENCHELINNRINNFLNALKNLGINTSETYIDFISQVPVFEIEVEKKLFSKTYNEIPKGFELKKNVHVKYTDPKIAEKMLIEAAKNEIYDIVKVDYIVQNQAAVYDSLRNSAIKIMNTKIKEMKKTGIKFESLFQNVSENYWSSYPLDRYSYYSAFNKPELNSKNQSSKYISSSHSDQSLYYNRIGYNKFDMVINPAVVEPVVQFSYTLKNRFVLKKQP